MSPLTIVTGPCSSAHLTLAREPRAKLSRITTSDAPARTSSSVMCDPIKPRPPVTRARLPRSVTAASLRTDMTSDSCEAFLIVGARADHPRRDAGDDRERRHVARDHRAGADDAAAADGDAGEDDGVHADVGPGFDAHGFDLEIGLHDRHVDGEAGVGRAEHLRTRPPADVVLEDQIAGVEVRLRSDPDVVADDARPVVAPLDVGLRADEHRVADLGAIEVLEAGAGADDQAVAGRARRGAPDRAPHHDVDRPLARYEAGVELDEPRVAVLRTQ